jgi:hypothetical protein
MAESTRTGLSTFGRAFWRATLDRAIKSFAQAMILVWPLADGVLNLWEAEWSKTLTTGALAFGLSILTSIVSAPVGPVDSPSTI